jgi:acyl-CoA thioester hydrolase
MDAQGHVNNARVVSYLEQARVAAFYDPLALGRGKGKVVARHEIEYKLPIVYSHEPLPIQLWISRVAGASFVVHNEISYNGRLAVTADTKIVMIDLNSGHPTRLSPQDRELLATFADEIES